MEKEMSLKDQVFVPFFEWIDYELLREQKISLLETMENIDDVPKMVALR